MSVFATFEELGFIQEGESGESEKFGTCIFCGKPRKLYVNSLTGQWECKSAYCGKGGNLFTFIREWYEQKRKTAKSRTVILSRERGLPKSLFNRYGFVWDSEDSRWVIPIKNRQGAVISLRLYKPGGRIMQLKGTDLYLFGMERVKDKSPIYLCEGEWDTLAMIALIEDSGSEGTAVGVPGAKTFKDSWAEQFTGKWVILCYDNDPDGESGARRAYAKLRSLVSRIDVLEWPPGTPEKFDVRDFRNSGGTLDTLLEMVKPFEETLKEEAESAQAAAVAEFETLSSGKRPGFESVLQKYRKALFMTKDMEDALRVIFATIISQQIEGDPLWCHICSPPGGSKTELLRSVAGCGQVVMKSTVTVHSLVSGWKMKGGGDPSLIPRLFGRTFVLKDFTEILGLPKAYKDEIYGILRGAYDGRVEKDFGNGIYRAYEGYFNMLSGVTPRIYAEKGAELGERFVIFYINEIAQEERQAAIMAAMQGVGREAEFRETLSQAAKGFLEYRISPEDVPEFPMEYAVKVMYLAQLVSMLRANVEKTGTSSGDLRISYRPKYEVGTRIAKQLKKLMLGLAMLKYPAIVDEECYQIARRVALNSCIGWNLEALIELTKYDGQTTDTIVDAMKVPKSTVWGQLEELSLLGVLRREIVGMSGGGKQVRWYLTDVVNQIWQGAGMPFSGEKYSAVSRNGKEAQNGHKNGFRLRRREFSKQGIKQID